MFRINMHKNISHKILFRLLTLVVISLFTLNVAAQTNMPRKLREDILKSKEKEDSRTRTARRKTFGSTPQAGAMVLRPANPRAQQGATLVKIESAQEMLYDESRLPGIKVLKGDVRFRQDNSLLYCDSAYFNEEANSFDAFDNVRIVQGDTLTIYGDFLNYDGNTKMARVWDNVKMVNKNTVLTTSELHYDRNINLAYYNTGGVIEDGENTLTSIWGQYSPSTKIAVFKDQVKMTNPESQLTTDTLNYNTSSSIADIVGNSLVRYKEDTDIYSQKGWYDTKNDQMMLLDRSLVEQRDGKTLIGDTIFYDKKQGYGEAYSNVEMNDPKQKATLFGNFVSYDEIKSVGLATDSALLVDWSAKDSLFLSADTLYTMKDSIETDTIAFNKVMAFKNVRFLRSDLQGMCDSLLYTSRDSIIHMRVLPVVWSDNNQLMGTQITAFTKNQKVEKVVIDKSGIAIQLDSLNYFNQLSGKEIIAHLDSGKLQRVYVNGNAESIFFPKDEKTKDFIGINKTLSSYVTMFFKDEKIERVLLTTASSGAMYPLSQMEEDDLYLTNFHWYEEERPRVVDDVFKKFVRTEPKKRPQSKKRPAFPGESSDPVSTTTTTSGSPARPADSTRSSGINQTQPQGRGVQSGGIKRGGLQQL